jgi:hypothetical protein
MGSAIMTIPGNIVFDLHVGHTAKDVTVINTVIAYDNEDSGKTAFMNLRAWGSVAQAMLRLLPDGSPMVRKGTRITVDLQPNSDTKLINGKTVTQLVFEVKKFSVLGQPRNAELIPIPSDEA